MDSGNRGFVALDGRTRAAMIAIACVPGFGVVTNLLRIAFGDSIAAHNVSRAIGLLFLADVLALALACVSAAVLFSVWLHRAVRNLAALGRTEMRYSPADAVISFFIPLVNFVRPLRVMKELWLATEPGVQADGYDWQRNGSATRLLDTWWGFLIASSVVRWWHPPTTGLGAFVGLVSAGLLAVAAVDCTRLMRGIALRQNAIAARLGFRSDEPYR